MTCDMAIRYSNTIRHVVAFCCSVTAAFLFLSVLTVLIRITTRGVFLIPDCFAAAAAEANVPPPPHPPIVMVHRSILLYVRVYLLYSIIL